MKKEQVMELLKNREFAEKLNHVTNEKDAMALFAEYGYDMTVEEFRTYFKKADNALSKDELAAVSGGETGVQEGISCFAIGIGFGENGYGCFGVGIGLCAYFGFSDVKPE